MSPSLVVPMRVEALPIGPGDRVRSIGPYADFGAVAGPYAPYVGAQVSSRLFSGGRPLETGVHVHWHLPRALRRAPVTRGAPVPPPAPDRWLVVRAVGTAAAAWVVESNALEDEPRYSETTVPGDVTRGERPFSYLGRVYALEDWPPAGDGPYLEGLTAFGYGIPDFAGCYAHCRNVFGLHDRSPVPGPLSYAVVGWHHDPALDPLRRGNLEALGWEVPSGVPEPERTLYFGAVRGVPFNPKGAHLDGQTGPVRPAVAIGNTPAEALAALAEPTGAAGGNLQRLFTAYQLGALRQLTGLAAVDERIHASGFASVDAGSTWELHARTGDALAEVPAPVARTLSWLNVRQRTYDLLRAERTTLRRRIFLDWCRRAELRAARWRDEIDLDGLDALIEAQLAELERRQAQLERHMRKIGVRRHRLRNDLPQDVRLARNAAPRFHRPNDPVVVLADDGIAGPAPEVKASVACASTSRLDEPPPLAGLEAAGRLPHHELAWLARHGVGTETDVPGLPEPAIALRDWELPWRPVELAWRVALQLPEELETGDPLATGVVLDNYAFDDEALDFEPCSDDYSGIPDEYEGRVPLAANATAALEAQVTGVVADTLLERLRAKPLVAQALGGFTVALGMLDDSLQLGVAEPNGSPLDAPFVRRVAAAVAGETRFGPLPDNPFAPLRSGRFTLRALRLIDEFGRWREVDVSAPAVAETIPCDGRTLLAPLRLTQAAQLRFRWRIGGRRSTDASVAPKGSPICGWVIPNRLDGGILLYDGSGDAVGRLVPGPGAPQPQWIAPPTQDDGDDAAQRALARCNPVLGALGNRLLRADAGYLRAFTATLEAVRATVAPSLAGADREIAVMLGTPLALVQAELDLTLLGLPQIDLSLRALRADIDRGDALARDDHGVTRVRFPVRLGHLAQADDGLIGFFAPGADGDPDFQTFHAAAGGGHPAIMRAEPDTLTVTADPGAQPLVVTLLIDPRCPVHAATGILPVKSLAIPGDLVTRGLAALEYTFPIGPVIAPAGPVGTPVPAAGAGWHWLDRGAERFEWTNDVVAELDPGLPPTGRQRVVDGWLKLPQRKVRR